ncbi:HlyD family efflux transporter periplasmic adaptor subunit [Methylococcus sp. EFPC2]|uniref:HlyD family efflux transporter periplasmic adaptor subunit n=1 Tax=Methylococcus sp. EFPC2 TaxID=2812648 RepID=UPI00196818AA|nr:HlyD family efflux transporter periplasmic adaptor subunit [Methylococcus sp. EFPC2]QSA95496.1 HlyD family efflux transporter periplasmic adaptor subunit [Methylococcus sp. EFPC2]
MKTYPKTLRARRNRRLRLAAFLVLASALAYAAYWWLHARFWVVTDNAFVTGNLLPVDADATGIVTQVLTEETRHVNKGDLLVRLDEHRALATLGQREGELGRTVRGLGALFATRQQLCQKVAARSAQLAKVRHDVSRFRQAIPSGSVSEQVLQNAEDQMQALEAEQREAEADLRAVESRVGGTRRVDHPEVEAAKQQFVNAYLELLRQQIRAPVSGYVASRKVQVGDRVHPGDPLMMVVPLDHLWVEANLRETELQHVRPGQAARVLVDVYGKERIFHGTVEGVNPGTGSVYALLPPDNATGNFIHIVQRVPVRIALDQAEVRQRPLRPGLSTVTSIHVSEPGQSVDVSLASTSTQEYGTDIFADELVAAERKAQEIILANVVPQSDTGDDACSVPPVSTDSPSTARRSRNPVHKAAR